MSPANTRLAELADANKVLGIFWRFESFIAYKNKYRLNQVRVYLVLDKVVRQGAVRTEVLVEA